MNRARTNVPFRKNREGGGREVRLLPKGEASPTDRSGEGLRGGAKPLPHHFSEGKHLRGDEVFEERKHLVDEDINKKRVRTVGEFEGVKPPQHPGGLGGGAPQHSKK